MSERISLISANRSGDGEAVFCLVVYSARVAFFFSSRASLDWTVFTLVTRDGAACFFLSCLSFSLVHALFTFSSSSSSDVLACKR